MRKMMVSASLALLVHQSVQAKEMQPNGQWLVDFGDSHCIAQRGYGDRESPTYFLMKASVIGDGVQLSMVANGPRANGIQERAKIGFDGGLPVELSQLRYGIDKKRVRTINLTKAHVEQLSRAAMLHWSAPNVNFSIPLGPVSNLVKLMEKCRSMLADDWNASSATKALLKQEPRLDKPVVELFSTDDYPSQAVFAEQSGTAKVVGLIDEKGEMADCMVVETSGVAVLDAQTCNKVKERGKFSPAIGQDGKPAKSVFETRVRWVMP